MEFCYNVGLFFAATVFRLCRVRISIVKSDKKISNHYFRKPQVKLLLAVLKLMWKQNIKVYLNRGLNGVF